MNYELLIMRNKEETNENFLDSCKTYIFIFIVSQVNPTPTPTTKVPKDKSSKTSSQKGVVRLRFCCL